MHHKSHVDIALAYSPRQKLLPKHEHANEHANEHAKAKYVLGAIHVNSGVTIQSQNCCVIYRLEEMHKVILHELFHIWQYGNNAAWANCNNYIDTAPANMNIGKLFNISPCPLMNEGYVDAMACLYLVGFRIFLWSNRNASMDTSIFYQAFTRQFTLDRIHIYTMAKQVIRFYEGRDWIEQTNAFSYYVIKALIWMHIEEFDKYYKCPHDFVVSLCTKANVAKLLAFDANNTTNTNTSLRMFPKMSF
jgi:hypothetical protein